MALEACNDLDDSCSARLKIAALLPRTPAAPINGNPPKVADDRRHQSDGVVVDVTSSHARRGHYVCPVLVSQCWCTMPRVRQLTPERASASNVTFNACPPEC